VHERRNSESYASSCRRRESYLFGSPRSRLYVAHTHLASRQSWFNYNKEREFRLFIEHDAEVNDASKKWIASSDEITESGATAGNA